MIFDGWGGIGWDFYWFVFVGLWLLGWCLVSLLYSKISRCVQLFGGEVHMELTTISLAYKKVVYVLCCEGFIVGNICIWEVNLEICSLL